MPETTNWNGTVWGETTRGGVVAQLIRENVGLKGKLSLFEPGLGQLHCQITGEWPDGKAVVATLEQFTGNYNVATTLPKTGVMRAEFDPAEGILNGEWETDLGTKGKFILVKIDLPQNQPVAQNLSSGNQVLPPQEVPPFITKTVVLSSYRLDADDIRRLADLIKSGTNVSIPAINASHQGAEHIHIGVDNLLADPAVPNVVHDMILAANEPSLNAGTNTVTLNLKKNDRNTLFISGYNQLWVEGKAAQIQTFLRDHESKATFIARNYGGILNSTIFLAMLAFLPSISSLRERLTVVAFVFLLLLLLLYSWRLAVNTKIFLRETKSSWYEKNAGWLLVLFEVGLSAWVAYLIHRYLGG